MRRLQQRGLAAVLVFVSAASVAHGQRAARLPWGNLDVAIFPDSAGGTLVWVASRAASPDDFGKDREFLMFALPDSVMAWIPRALAFLDYKMTDADTAQAIESNELNAVGYGSIGLARRR